jgi:hypothetical protein
LSHFTSPFSMAIDDSHGCQPNDGCHLRPKTEACSTPPLWYRV